ncbi:glycosyltransferase family 2 protein [Candidatus Beckwithbacteria bacterium]|nr:glycosyltransferase family 2 protein [Candidatus Beckwithbacteria bacterium]
MKVVIVIPTYNEKDNIGKLASYLETKIFPKLKKEFDPHILIVDDSSPDGTADIVRTLQKKYKNIHLFLNKKKSGLGGAYLKGMSYATDKLKADVMFEMDADFSHDPDVIPQFLQKIKEGNDLVLGSRYIKGGSIPKNWGFHRKLFSILGNIIIQVVLTHFAIRDWTTGYRALRTELFEALRAEMKKREFSGYTWQIGFLHKTVRKGFKVAEVPIHFVDREYGKSKLGTEYIKNTLFYIFTIRIQELKQIIKFGIVGLVGFIINFTALEVFHQAFGISPDNAAALGAELAIISNFTLNNIWTFKAQKITKPKQIAAKFVQFNVASLGAIIIQKVTVWIGMQLFGDSLYRLYFLIAVAIGTGLNYMIYTKFIWKK